MYGTIKQSETKNPPYRGHGIGEIGGNKMVTHKGTQTRFRDITKPYLGFYTKEVTLQAFLMQFKFKRAASGKNGGTYGVLHS